jgi:hypothetical protein
MLRRNAYPCFVITTLAPGSIGADPPTLLTFTVPEFGELLREFPRDPLGLGGGAAVKPIFLIVELLVSTEIVGGAPGIAGGRSSAGGAPVPTFTGTTKKG